MLNIQIDNSELEKAIHQNYGTNTNALAQDFASFLLSKTIKNDIKISITQLNQGDGLQASQVMEDLVNKYE